MTTYTTTNDHTTSSSSKPRNDSTSWPSSWNNNSNNNNAFRGIYHHGLIFGMLVVTAVALASAWNERSLRLQEQNRHNLINSEQDALLDDVAMTANVQIKNVVAPHPEKSDPNNNNKEHHQPPLNSLSLIKYQNKTTDETTIQIYVPNGNSTTNTKSTQQQHNKNLIQSKLIKGHRKPPLEYYFQPKPTTRELLQFTILGFAKSGTTFLNKFISLHPHICTPNEELHDWRMPDASLRVSEILYDLDDRDDDRNRGKSCRIRGYKSPRQIVNVQKSLSLLHNTFPDATLIVGLRHPVWWFQSFYNYQRIFHHRPFDAQTPNDLRGNRCENGVCTDNARFHVFLSYFGKTSRTTQRELELLQQPPSLDFGNGTNGTTTHNAWNKTLVFDQGLTNPVFLFETNQLNKMQHPNLFESLRVDLSRALGLWDENEYLSKNPWEELAKFRPLVANKTQQEHLAKLQQLAKQQQQAAEEATLKTNSTRRRTRQRQRPHHRHQQQSTPQFNNSNNTANNVEEEESLFDICQAQYQELRHELLNIGKNAASWITEFLLPLPDVTVSEPEAFVQLLQQWGTDPC